MDKDKTSRQMDGVLQIFKEEIATIRTGRATPALIEGIEVEVYEAQPKMKLMELGSIMVEGARSLVFQPWDKTIIKRIKNGILQSARGFNPVVDGDRIRIQLPQLTTEQREDYLKLLGKKLEAARVMIRNARSDTRHQLQEELKGKSLGEDDFHRLEKDLQKLTDKYIADLEEMFKKKEEEIRI